jgi:hypothetical protein
VNVGFQDKNESNAYFIYEKYLILSQREREREEKEEKTCNVGMLFK